MSGANVPYQLRPNKAVERFLWLDALDHLNKIEPLKDYAYISMGGRYLEDFKLVHARFGIRELHSIEMDEIAHKRQVFNSPLSFLTCHKMSTGEFVDNFASFSHGLGDRHCIFWFDYASPKRLSQLQEVQTLVAKLDAKDVLKVTLNAEFRTLGDSTAFASRAEFQASAAAKLTSQLAAYCPDEGVRPDEITPEGLAVVLAKAVKKAFLKGLEGTPELTATPLACFRYSDGFHQMLTVAAVILDEGDQHRFETRTKLSKWEFRAKEWDTVHEVSVPDLSVKERITIDADLFAGPIEDVHKALTFRLDENEEDSLKALKNYETHYRRYPQFLRVNL